MNIGEQEIEALVTSLRQYARARKNDCDKRLESPELSALLVEKYAWGMHEALTAIDFEANTSPIISEADNLCLAIDPDHVRNRRLRYDRFAKLDLTTPRQR